MCIIKYISNEINKYIQSSTSRSSRSYRRTSSQKLLQAYANKLIHHQFFCQSFLTLFWSSFYKSVLVIDYKYEVFTTLLNRRKVQTCVYQLRWRQGAAMRNDRLWTTVGTVMHHFSSQTLTTFNSLSQSINDTWRWTAGLVDFTSQSVYNEIN